MDKVLVEISVPAAGRSFDVFIPQTSKMSEVVMLVSKSLAELSAGKFKPDYSTILCVGENL